MSSLQNRHSLEVLSDKVRRSAVLRATLEQELREQRVSHQTYCSLVQGIPDGIPAAEATALEDAISSLGFWTSIRSGVANLGALDTNLKRLAQTAATKIAQVAASVGRIEVTGGPFDASADGEAVVGTGWVVGPNTIMTAGHVAGVLLRSGRLRTDLRPRIDFGEELGDDRNNLQVPIIDAKPHSGLDVGLLTTTGPLPPALSIATAAVVAHDTPVFTVGYPSTPETPTRFFKMLSCGYVMGSPDPASGALESSYPHSGGLSGGPVCSLSSGLVVALHYRGQTSPPLRSISSPMPMVIAALGGSIPETAQASGLNHPSRRTKSVLDLTLSELVAAAESGDRDLVRSARAILKAALRSS